MNGQPMAARISPPLSGRLGFRRSLDHHGRRRRPLPEHEPGREGRLRVSAAPENHTASFSGFDERYQIFEGMKSDQWSAELRKARDKAKPCQIAGYPMAFEQNEGCPDFGSYCVSILLGPFGKGKRAGEATLYTLRNTPLGFRRSLEA